MKRAPRLCGCGGLIVTQCSGCGKQHRKERRPSARERGYCSKWDKFRKQYIVENSPIQCNDCHRLLDGTVRERRIELHHIQKVKDSPHLRLEASNIMPLCPACHRVRTLRGE